MGFFEHSQHCRRIHGNRTDGCSQFENAVVGEELHSLQTGRGGGRGRGTGAGVEGVGLGAVRQSVLLELQVTGQRVNLMNDLVTRRGSVSVWQLRSAGIMEKRKYMRAY